MSSSPSPSPSSSPSPSPSSSLPTGLSVALIGAGGRVRTHCRAPSTVDGVEPGPVCDVVPDRTDLLAADPDPDVDVAYVPASPRRMDPIVTDRPKAGLHTFAGKPPGVTAAMTDRWARLAVDRDLRTAVGFQRRFHPPVVAAREAVAERGPVGHAAASFHKERLGDVTREDGRYDALLREAIHALDRLVAAREVEAVHGFCGQLFEPAERFDPLYADAFAGVLALDGGGFGLPSATRSAGGRAITAEFHGRAVSGYAEIHGDPELDGLVIRRDGEPYAEAERLTTVDALGAARDGAVPGPAIDGTLQISRQFLDCVRSGDPTRIGFGEAVRTMTVLEGVLDGRRLAPLLEGSA